MYLFCFSCKCFPRNVKDVSSRNRRCVFFFLNLPKRDVFIIFRRYYTVACGYRREHHQHRIISKVIRAVTVRIIYDTDVWNLIWYIWRTRLAPRFFNSLKLYFKELLKTVFDHSIQTMLIYLFIFFSFPIVLKSYNTIVIISTI